MIHLQLSTRRGDRLRCVSQQARGRRARCMANRARDRLRCRAYRTLTWHSDRYTYRLRLVSGTTLDSKADAEVVFYRGRTDKDGDRCWFLNSCTFETRYYRHIEPVREPCCTVSFCILEKSCCSCFFFLFVLQTVETRRKLSSPSSDNCPSSWAAASKGDDVL